MALGDEDPFEATHFYLGDPETDILFGDPDPITERVEKWGRLGPDCLLGDVEFTICFGRNTMTPDRYQATVIRDDDELLVRGEVNETHDGFVLRGTADHPLIVVAGDRDEASNRLYSKSRAQAAIGFVLISSGFSVHRFF